MEKMKINQFNFIMEDFDNGELSIESRYNNKLQMDYFYIDGKENILFVNQEITNIEFKEEVSKKFNKIINYIKSINQQIDSSLDKKVEEMLKNGDYSRYSLYKDFSINILRDILDEKTSTYKLSYDASHFKINVKENVLISGNEIVYNPYTNNVENFEELFEKGKFSSIIKNKLIRRELERTLAPKFIYELINIYCFLQDKKTVGVKLKGCEKFKSEASINHIIRKEYRGNNYELNNEEAFEEANPNKKFKDMQIDDLVELVFGRNESLKVNPENLKNLDSQIAISYSDKLLFKLDELEENLDSQFYDYRDNVSDKLHISSIYDLNCIFRDKDYYKDRLEQVSRKEMDILVDFHRKSILIDVLKKEINFKELKELVKLTKDEELSDIEKNLKNELDKLQEIYDCNLNDNERNILECIQNNELLAMYGIKNFKSIIKQVEIAQNEFYKIENDIATANKNNIPWEELYKQYNGYWKKTYENGEVEFGAYFKPIEFTVKSDINGNLKINSEDINVFPDNITNSSIKEELFNLDFNQNIDFEKIKRIVARNINQKQEECEEAEV